MAESIELIATVAPGNDLGEVVARLRAQGFAPTAVLAELSLVVGTAGADQLAALRGLAGVLAVEASQPIDLPPPDGPQ